MDSPIKFDGMTDEQIGSYLNVDGNIELLTESEMAWLLPNKQSSINLIDFGHLDNFNEKISQINLSAELTQSQILSIITDGKLTVIEKTGTVAEVETLPDGSTESINVIKTIKLDLTPLSNSIQPSAGSSATRSLIDSAKYFGEISAIVSVMALVNNSSTTAPVLPNTFPQGLNGIFKGFYDEVTKMATAIKDFKFPDLKNSIDSGFGFTNSTGGANSTGTLLGYGGTQSPANSQSTATAGSTHTTPDTTLYTRLENTLNTALRQDWKTKNAKPGNPLILTAYALSGRNYDQDGTTGEYAWATAFVNWVLNKSGLEYMKVMSPMAYAGYGSPVTIGTFKTVRKNDLIILSSIHGIGHIGFIRAYDPKTNQVTILGGNQAGTVKLTKISVSRSDPSLYVSHIRRNWAIPADQDVPLFQTNELPTRPGQQTSGKVFPTASTGGPTRFTPETTAERIDRLSGSGSTLA